jgi:hypothetical protein
LNKAGTYEELQQQRTIKHRGLKHKKNTCEKAVNSVELKELNQEGSERSSRSCPNKEGRASEEHQQEELTEPKRLT